MAVRCFRKADSSPPVCGVHKVRLLKTRTSEELSVSGFKDLPFYLCPTSRKAIKDSTDRQSVAQAENRPDAD
jgi:hypothetical protein